MVDKDGKIKDAKVLRGVQGGCDEEALRVVRSMPDWKPGRQNGRNVQVQYTTCRSTSPSSSSPLFLIRMDVRNSFAERFRFFLIS